MGIDIIFKESVLYRYELWEYKKLVDKLVLPVRKDAEVIERASTMFHGKKRNLDVVLNGEIIFSFRNSAKMILNKENGRIYSSLLEMADEENISLYKARKWLKNKLQFTYLYEE